MTKSIFALFTILLMVSGAVAYQQYQEDHGNVLHKVQNEAAEALMERMDSEVCAVYEDGSVTMISAYDNLAYAVSPDQTLGEAIAMGSFAQEKGNCVREDPDNPPDEGEVACKCFEHTNCNGTESTTCKRHCKKELCKCCPGI